LQAGTKIEAVVHPTAVSKPRSNKKDLGALLQVKLRHLREKGAWEHAFPIRRHENLELLAKSFLVETKLPPSAQVQLIFDGEPLALNRTPASYDMETDDLIDVECSHDVCC
jgi:hypothetical protein